MFFICKFLRQIPTPHFLCLLIQALQTVLEPVVSFELKLSHFNSMARETSIMLTWFTHNLSSSAKTSWSCSRRDLSNSCAQVPEAKIVFLLLVYWLEYCLVLALKLWQIQKPIFSTSQFDIELKVWVNTSECHMMVSLFPFIQSFNACYCLFFLILILHCFFWQFFNLQDTTFPLNLPWLYQELSIDVQRLYRIRHILALLLWSSL